VTPPRPPAAAPPGGLEGLSALGDEKGTLDYGRHFWTALVALQSPTREKGPGMTPTPFRPTHRHRKGGLYELLGYGRHTETGDALAVYRSDDGTLWVRPREMFDDGRFTPHAKRGRA
jgi:hypothetical protein